MKYVVGLPEWLREVLTLANILRDLMIGRHIVTLSHFKIGTLWNLSRNLRRICFVGNHIRSVYSHEVVFLNNRAFS